MLYLINNLTHNGLMDINCIILIVDKLNPLCNTKYFELKSGVKPI